MISISSGILLASTTAVLGLSWGGVLAVEYEIRHPDRVSHLILLQPAPARSTLLGGATDTDPDLKGQFIVEWLVGG